MSLAGLCVPLITPFTANDELDCTALQKLAGEVLDDGASGLVALGTTAEPANLTASERAVVVEICADACAARSADLIVGVGSNSTSASVTRLATLTARAAAALAVVPYYTRPCEDGVVEHFRRLAAASPVPLVIYNVPHRTARALSADTLLQLAELPNVAGFKHAVGGIDDTTIAFLSTLPDHTSVLAGDDLFAGPLIALGATGAILASANVAAGAYVQLLQAWRAGPRERAQHLHNQLAPLSAALFAEPNPVVIKAVLAARGTISSPQVRLPLLPAGSAATAAALSRLPDHQACSAATGFDRLRALGSA
jgi:4-hydroxy-tetrahydrodipicolinate synthase